MIAIDTSSLIAFFEGASEADVEAVDSAFDRSCAVLPPVVLTEMLSDHKLSGSVVQLLTSIPRLELLPGYWERAGLLRSRMLRRGLRARLPDTLIAQSCIDHGVPLITRAADYRHFAKYAGLVLFR